MIVFWASEFDEIGEAFEQIAIVSLIKNLL